MMASGFSQGVELLAWSPWAGSVSSASLLGPFFWPPCTWAVSQGMASLCAFVNTMGHP